MSEHQSRGSASLASRYGLVRPLQGRYVAGVCAGLGRSTGTDPVLWRVVLAVLVCFAGIGALIYLALWVLTPEEGDTASPVEALLGRGHSNTSPALVVILCVVAVLLLVLILPRPIYLVLLGGVLVLTVLLLTNRSAAGGSAGPAPSPAAASGSGSPPPTGVSAAETPTTAATDTPPPDPPHPVNQPVTVEPPDIDRPTPAYQPPVPAPGPSRPEPAGYRPPFAPHGPFAGPPPPPPPPPPPSPPPPEPHQRSPLSAVTFFAVLAVIGALGVLSLTGALDVPAAGYVAAGLAVVGAGLLAGAWLGRARGLIALGVVLALALPVAHAADTWEPPDNVGDITWAPQSRAGLQDEYSVMFGAGVLDLRQIDLAGEDVEIRVEVMFGDIQIIVPEDVPVHAAVNTRFGNATVFGSSTVGVTEDTFTDGAGEPGEPTLRLELHSRFAHMEVQR